MQIVQKWLNKGTNYNRLIVIFINFARNMRTEVSNQLKTEIKSHLIL